MKAGDTPSNFEVFPSIIFYVVCEKYIAIGLQPPFNGQEFELVGI